MHWIIRGAVALSVSVVGSVCPAQSPARDEASGQEVFVSLTILEMPVAEVKALTAKVQPAGPIAEKTSAKPKPAGTVIFAPNGPRSEPSLPHEVIPYWIGATSEGNKLIRSLQQQRGIRTHGKQTVLCPNGKEVVYFSGGRLTLPGKPAQNDTDWFGVRMAGKPVILDDHRVQLRIDGEHRTVFTENKEVRLLVKLNVDLELTAGQTALLAPRECRDGTAVIAFVSAVINGSNRN